MEHVYAVIMAGGKGERFWPLSTAARPKQLLALVEDKPLLAMAVDRIRPLLKPDRIFVITSEALVAATRRVVPGLPRRNIIGEPCGRDTAAAIALATGIIKGRDPDAVFCVLTADHVIRDLDLFRETLAESLHLARLQDVLITIGIKPTYPSTGFGYVEAGQEAERAGHIRFLRGKRFLEKPDAATAARFVRARRYYWNSGMFIWSVRAIEAAMAAHCPALADLIEKAAAARTTRALDNVMEAVYPGLERISIDYAIMEKVSNILMAEGLFRWDDVGSWPALAEFFRKDGAGNVMIGRCEQVDCAGNIVYSRERLTALLGVKDVIVVQAGGATLVCARNRAQDLKRIVQHLSRKPGHEDVL